MKRLVVAEGRREERKGRIEEKEEEKKMKIE